MSAAKVPQDFRSKAPRQLKEAVGLQAANITQKGMLDNLSTKVIMALNIVRRDSAAKTHPVALQELNAVLTMDRYETAKARESFVYPEAQIQAVIDKAVDEITAILLENVD